MNMTPRPPVPSFIPESAPFSPEQRTWLNGLFAGLFELEEGATPLSAREAMQLLPAILFGAAVPAASRGEDDGAPWHDPAMPLPDRMKLAEGRALPRRLMAAMAQQDCGQCGYNCNDYANSLFAKSEKRLNLCVPGGKDTARMVKQLYQELERAPAAPAEPAPAAIIAPALPGRSRDNPIHATFLSRRRLNKPGSQKETWHIEIDLAGTDLDYVVGDSFGIFPVNDPDLVDAVLAAIDAPPDFPIGGHTLRDELTEGASLSPAPDMLFELISYLTGGERRQKAKRLAAGEDPDGDAATLDVLAALQKFRKIRPDPEAFIEALDPLQPRLYSIASSLKSSPGRVALTVDTVRYEVDQRTRLGACSGFLGGQIAPGDKIRVYVQKAQHFALPADPAKPIVMIGPGTGIAPFRAFLHERRATQAPGRNWLFFGHQRSNCDFFYEDELAAMHSAGLLTRLTLAWSRDGSEKVYVQHRMREAGRDLWSWIQDGAHIYVCGDAKHMAKDVEIGACRHYRGAWRLYADGGREGPGRIEGRRPLSGRRLLGDSLPVSDDRSPAEIATTRMAPLSRLPAFFALEDKCAVVAGGSAPAAWKAELLSAAGARVDVFAPAPGEEMRALAAAPPRGPVAIHGRGWTADDFAGAAIAVADCADDVEAAAFAAAARSAGVPVNVIDRPAFCDFSFGAIVNRSPLVIGISTDGASPVFAQAIRAKIEALIPKGFARWAEAARSWRPHVAALALPFRGRRGFWETFTARAVAAPDRAPTDADLDALLAPPAQEAGSVVLVGAGPGNPELLTLRAVRALQSADVILFDDLVAADILDFARREAKKMLVGKTGHKDSCRQDDINALMISLAKAGRRVVRLKGGDPMIFGRADEEIAACRAAGIAVEVVPGVTTAQGAASRLLASLTRRGQARRVQYVTGHGHDGKLPADIDWQSLADPAVTTVVYMPTKTLPELVATALRAGLDPATPAVAVERATRPDERVTAATIATLPARLAAEPPSGPLVVMIGRVFADYVESVTLPRHLEHDPEKWKPVFRKDHAQTKY